MMRVWVFSKEGMWIRSNSHLDLEQQHRLRICPMFKQPKNGGPDAPKEGFPWCSILYPAMGCEPSTSVPFPSFTFDFGKCRGPGPRLQNRIFPMFFGISFWRSTGTPCCILPEPFQRSVSICGAEVNMLDAIMNGLMLGAPKRCFAFCWEGLGHEPGRLPCIFGLAATYHICHILSNYDVQLLSWIPVKCLIVDVSNINSESILLTTSSYNQLLEYSHWHHEPIIVNNYKKTPWIFPIPSPCFPGPVKPESGPMVEATLELR